MSSLASISSRAPTSIRCWFSSRVSRPLFASSARAALQSNADTGFTDTAQVISSGETAVICPEAPVAVSPKTY